MATDLDKGQTFPDSGNTYKRIDLSFAPLYLRDMVLPVVFINLGIPDEDQWMFDYKVTFFYENSQPYSWTVSGVVLDQRITPNTWDSTNGRPFPTLFLSHGTDFEGRAPSFQADLFLLSPDRSSRHCSTAGRSRAVRIPS